MRPNSSGPDISHYQSLTGPPDQTWNLVTAKCSEGRSSDATFAGNMLWASSARWRGGYHWLRSDSSMAVQAANYVSLMRRVTGTRELPKGWFCQTDWEVTPNIPLVTSDMCVEFNDRVQQEFNRECVVTYSSDWLPDSTLDLDSRGEFIEWRTARPHDPLWYANYNTVPNNQGTDGWSESHQYGADVWQWTSSYLHPSISGGRKGFDMNHVWNPDVLDRVCGYAHIPPIVIPPILPPIITPITEGELMNCYYEIVNDARTEKVSAAILIGTEDANHNVLNLRWSGDTPPERRALDNHIAAGMQRRQLTWGQVANSYRIGRLPVNDPLHNWTGAEFATPPSE